MTRRKRVLVVDDNLLNFEIIEEAIADRVDLIHATTGHEALRMAERLVPRIILLDIMLPDLDGYEVCRRLRRMPCMFDAHIVMLSARAMPSDHANGFAAGADEYLTKPFHEEELWRAIQAGHSERLHSYGIHEDG